MIFSCSQFIFPSSKSLYYAKVTRCVMLLASHESHASHIWIAQINPFTWINNFISHAWLVLLRFELICQNTTRPRRGERRAPHENYLVIQLHDKIRVIMDFALAHPWHHRITWKTRAAVDVASALDCKSIVVSATETSTHNTAVFSLPFCFSIHNNISEMKNNMRARCRRDGRDSFSQTKWNKNRITLKMIKAHKQQAWVVFQVPIDSLSFKFTTVNRRRLDTRLKLATNTRTMRAARHRSTCVVQAL